MSVGCSVFRLLVRPECVSDRTDCWFVILWEFTHGKDAEQTSFTAGPIADDDQLPANRLIVVWVGRLIGTRPILSGRWGWHDDGVRIDTVVGWGWREWGVVVVGMDLAYGWWRVEVRWLWTQLGCTDDPRETSVRRGDTYDYISPAPELHCAVHELTQWQSVWIFYVRLHTSHTHNQPTKNSASSDDGKRTTRGTTARGGRSRID
jgi:hypothetical protein